jgi:hypothetical protein
MLNLDETLELLTDYNIQRDLFLKCFLYSVGVIVIIDIVRQQLPEINLLQLIPGYYLFLLFSTFLILIFLSNFSIRLPFFIETKKSFGTKTINKLSLITNFKNGFNFLFLTLICSLTTVIPISLDSFNFYGEKTLENIWSIDEVVNLEIILVIILIILSQLPTLLLIILGGSGNSAISILQKYWKIISFSTFVISGFLTPTIDGYTQLSFSGFTLSFYLLVIISSLKRSITKINGNITLGF